jgi:hypothetical protein
VVRDRDLYSPSLGSQYETNGILRTGILAGAVANATRGLDENRLAVQEAKNFTFRASCNASSAAETARGVDDRVKRRGLCQAGLLSLVKGPGGFGMATLAISQVEEPDRHHGDQVDKQEGEIKIHRGSTISKIPANGKVEEVTELIATGLGQPASNVL